MKKIVLAFCLFLMAIPMVSSEEKQSVAVADSFIKKYPDPDSIHGERNLNHFSWQAGYMMFTMEKLWLATGNSRYYDYIQRYVDQQVMEDGSIPDFKPGALDNFIPGYAILFMYEQTGDEKYKTAADTIRKGFDSYRRNSDGGFWHGNWAKNQMWVDGVYMGQMFLLRYAKSVGDAEYCHDEIMKQMTLIVEHCQLPNGLLLHAYDESRKAKWADETTGLAPHVWSEGLGWYAVLIADALEYFPNDSEEHETLLGILQKMCSGLREVQDEETGLWFQVVEKPNAPGNWNETSGSAMFTYLIQKSIQRNYIDADRFSPVVEKAYTGLKTKAIDKGDGTIDIIDCSSIGVKATYEDYIKSPKEVNSFAPVSSFILGTLSVEYPESLK